MHDRIKWTFDMEVVADIVFDKRKSLVPEYMGEVVHSSGDEVVHADHGMSCLQQPIGEMTPEKSGSACNKDTHTMIPLLRFSHRECHGI
jgi:hypothetical protein